MTQETNNSKYLYVILALSIVLVLMAAVMYANSQGTLQTEQSNEHTIIVIN